MHGIHSSVLSMSETWKYLYKFNFLRTTHLPLHLFLIVAIILTMRSLYKCKISKVWKFGFDSALISSKLWKFEYIEDMSCKRLGSYPLRCWTYTYGSRTNDYPGVNRNGYFEVENIKHFEHTDYKQLIVDSNCSLAWIMYITGDTLTDQVVVGRTLLTASKFGVQALIQLRLAII